MKLAALFCVLAATSTVSADTWGPAYSLGPTAANSAVIESLTTFNPGTPPSPTEEYVQRKYTTVLDAQLTRVFATINSYLFLWPGVSNATSGLIQSGADSIADMQAYCGATSAQWCVSASYFGVGGQFSGDLVPVDANTPITIHYKLQSNNVDWVQTVTVNGQAVSTYTSHDGPLIQGGWGTGTECQQSCTGTGSAQTYTNTTITLSNADPNFNNTLGKGAGVVASDLLTADGGKTWTIGNITIPKYTAA